MWPRKLWACTRESVWGSWWKWGCQGRQPRGTGRIEAVAMRSHWFSLLGGFAATVGLACGAAGQPCGEGTWMSVTNSGPSPRYGMGMVYDPGRQHVVLFGGASSAGYLGD